MAPRIWLVCACLEVRKYLYSLKESGECCHLPVLSWCYVSLLLSRANFQRYLQWYFRIVFLDLLYRFFCSFCLDLHIKFDFCHFILCRRRCICVVGTCSMNSSEGERFTLFCGIAHLFFATIFGNFSLTFLYLCELLFLHYSHHFLFPSRADPGFVLLCKRQSRIYFL